MPTGVPVLGSSGSDGQLVSEDLENSNASTRHPAPSPPPRTDRAGDRRCGTRFARASATTAGKGQSPKVRPMSRDMKDLSPETYVVNPDTSSGMSLSSDGTTALVGAPGSTDKGRQCPCAWRGTLLPCLERQPS